MHHKNGRPIHHSIWTKIEFFKFFRHSVIISHHFQIEHWSKTIEQQLKCMVKCRLCMLFCIRCIVGAQLTWSLAKTVITYKYGYAIILERVTNSLNTLVKMHPKSMFEQQLLLIISYTLIIKCFEILDDLIMHNKTKKPMK